MERYQLYYRDFLLGVLEVDPTNGKHCYTPNRAVIDEIDKRYPLDPILLGGSDGFVNPIPFFKSRLYQMRRWNLTEINYQTDYFLLKRVE